ncbi:DNA polymerase III subunit beta [Texas Phoenix palm phytoplasma]|uniref:DNA polymerase III subunit beta n=1 Tax=Texas Phoenix palm phytoplasma TaxID=176709 RepID=A0ABS5BI20_9MOLU|nr:DNA polymerase III subunit beta [Texas Phoenix palm phytoplasma]MBP3059229.1 DNA polymerase III subunit beta [Texas Phoenix palm phytoplasma]
MNFEIKKEVFLHYLNQMQKILPQKTLFPPNLYIKITMKEDYFFLEVNNANVSVRKKVKDDSLKVIQQGSITVLGKHFTDIIKKIDHDFLKMATMEKRFLIIQTETSEYKLKTMNPDLFPFLSDFSFDFENCFEIESECLIKLIKETIVAASKEKTKVILTGLNLIYKKPFLTAIATDYFRVSQKKIPLNIDYSDFNVVVPVKSLEELNKLLEQQEEKVLKISINEQKFCLNTDSLSFQTILLEGEYPKIPKIKEDKFCHFFTLNRVNLIKILERLSLFLPKEGDISENIVEFKINEKSKVEISSCSEIIGKAIEEIEILEEFLQNNYKTAFNLKSLEEILKVFPTKYIDFRFEIPTKPFIISNSENPSLLYLIFPFFNK